MNKSRNEEMMMRSNTLRVAVALVLTYGMAQSAFSQLKKSVEMDLVPAALRIRTDSDGNKWNLESNGTLGRVDGSMINSGVSLLVNDEQFHTYQPMMTKDGTEFFLRGRPVPSVPGLEVVRRITYLEKEGAIRYIERFTNTTSNEVRLTVSLRSNFSGNFKTYLTDEGKTGIDMLGDRESAILVTPGSKDSDRAVVYTLTSSQSELKPTIANQNRYGLTFQYSLMIPPGQTKSLGHVIAQVPVPQEFDQKTLGKIFQPYSLDSMMASIPSAIQKELANCHVGNPFDKSVMFQSTGIDSLGVKRGRRDVLASGAETRLIGSAKCSGLTLKNEFGEALIPIERVAAIEGLNGSVRDSVRIFLNDGQIFSGKCEAAEFEFLLVSGGRVPLDFQSLDRLVMAVDKTNGSSDGEATSLIETFEGDRITMQTEEALVLQGKTPWGTLDFSLSDIEWLSPLDKESGGQFVSLRDGTRCSVSLAGEPMRISSDLFGDIELPVTSVRAVMSLDVVETVDAAIVDRSQVMIGDLQRIVGEILNPTLTVMTDSQAIEVSSNEVRELNRSDNSVKETASVFELKLWGGGTVTGKLKDSTISMQVRGKEWKLLAKDIQSLSTPAPQLSEGKQKEISQLIKSLGAADWAVRRSSTSALVDFGLAGKSVLENSLKSSSDPEVRRRITRILREIQ